MVPSIGVVPRGGRIPATAPREPSSTSRVRGPVDLGFVDPGPPARYSWPPPQNRSNPARDIRPDLVELCSNDESATWHIYAVPRGSPAQQEWAASHWRDGYPLGCPSRLGADQ